MKSHSDCIREISVIRVPLKKIKNITEEFYVDKIYIITFFCGKKNEFFFKKIGLG